MTNIIGMIAYTVSGWRALRVQTSTKAEKSTTGLIWRENIYKYLQNV